MIEIPQPLLDEISSGRATLFLGAGASVEAGFPSSSDIANFLIEKSGPKFKAMLTNQPLDAIAQYLYQQPGYGKQWVRTNLIQLFDEKHKVLQTPPSKAHKILPTIKWRSLFTTNFDRLIEISYDTNKDSVQRYLPVYKPDPQILRHEENVVRYIKLNGSIDEAARNVAHELVLTFAEQQEAKSKNAQFYQLLREESINGPIIFIGFRFVHPGTQILGASPEFVLLQEILREMGPAARWHYCVAPFEPTSEQAELMKTILLSNQIEPINCKFGDFLEAVNQHVTGQATSLSSRPPIIVPLGSENIQIDADDYMSDIRHFELFGHQIEKIAPPSIAESMNGHENWGSFFNRHLIERLCKKDVISRIQLSSQSAPEMISLVAPTGWGKTFLMRDLIVEFYRQRRPVFWLKPSSTVEIYTEGGRPITFGSWDATRIEHLLGIIQDKCNVSGIPLQNYMPIIFADNCSERAAELISLFRSLLSNNRSFILLFSARDYEFESLINEHPLIKKSRRIILHELYDSKDEVRTLIDFCLANKISTIERSEQKEVIAQRIIEEEAEQSLLFALQVIFDKEHRPFSEIVRGIWNDLADDYAKKMVIRVSTIHRFGSLFSPRLYSLLLTFPPHERSAVLDVYQSCLGKNVLFERMEEQEPCISTLHPLVAEKIASVSGVLPVELDNELLKLIKAMTNNLRDIELIRRLLKRITDYKINLSSEEKTAELFEAAAATTKFDWVVCQQYAKFLVQRRNFEQAYAWAQRAIENNPDHAPLHHTKGNVLRGWGQKLLLDDKAIEAKGKFDEARKCFAISRTKPEPDEFGFVTHLDMLLWLLQKETDDIKKAELRAEGARLYKQGITALPSERFNLLLEDRFRNAFDLSGSFLQSLTDKIENAVIAGKASIQGAVFVANERFKGGNYKSAISILEKQKEISETSPLLWIREAELHAKHGSFEDAAKCVDAAKRREQNAEDDEVRWLILYWNLLDSLIISDYSEARAATVRLSESGFFSKQLFPRGYFWKPMARNIKPQNRIFKDHAKIWEGRIDQIRAGGQYGQIAISNSAGDRYFVPFNPRYFGRRDLRQGEYIKFVLTILPSRVRADDISSTPFVNTVDDLFVP